MTKFFITGGAGFIGTNLAQKLSNAKSNEVYIYDNFWRDALQYTKLPERPNIHVFSGDVCDHVALSIAMERAKPQYIVHAASIAGVNVVMNHPVRTMRTILDGTKNALGISKDLNVKLFVDLSTSEIYGPFADEIKEEQPAVIEPPGKPRWVYAAAKYAAEHLVWSYYDEFGLPTCTMRPFNVYGPGQVGEGAIQIFIKKALKNETIELNNGGKQIRDWCYVDDMVAATMASFSRVAAVSGEVFNIGSEQCITIHDLAHLIVEMTESESKIVDKEWNHPDVDIRTVDISKSKEILNLKPSVTLKEGLKRTIEWQKRIL